MENWSFLIPSGRLFKDFASIGGLFLLAMIVRRYVPILQKYLVPANIIAGVLGLVFGPEILGIIEFDSDRMGVYVYHLLALTFIAVSLNTGKRKLGSSAIFTGLILVATYVVQAVVGIFLGLLIKYFFFEDLFPGFGMLLPLGFGMGPGITFSISKAWEAHGFVNGGVAGLTLSTVGYAWAYVGGVIMLRRGIKKGLSKNFTGEINDRTELKTGYLLQKDRNSAGLLTTPTEVIESLTIHFALVGLVYLLTIFVCQMLEILLISVGAENEVVTLWSFHFLIGSLCAIAVRKVIDFLGLDVYFNEDMMLRTANLFVDYMIAASIIAISVAVAYYYILPLTVIGLAGGIITYFMIHRLVNYFFKTNVFERFIAFYGNATGTIQSGLVLLRVIDPEFKSGAADDLVYGSGVALLLGFPLLILINMPVNYFENSVGGYIIVSLILTVYFFILVGLGFLRKPTKS